MDNQNTNQSPPPQTTPPTQPSAQTGTDKEVILGKYKVKVLRNVCIGAATCVAVSPNTFKLDSENKAIVKSGSTDPEQTILMAAQSCPVKAIEIYDNETNQKIWPQ